MYRCTISLECENKISNFVIFAIHFGDSANITVELMFFITLLSILFYFLIFTHDPFVCMSSWKPQQISVHTWRIKLIWIWI